MDFRGVQQKLIRETIDGAGLYAIEKIVDKTRISFYEIEKNAKQYAKPGIMIGLSLIADFVPQISKIPYVPDWLQLAGKVGVKEVFRNIIDKPAYLVAEDENTLHAYNFEDLNNLILFIDGEKKTAGTDYTTDGTADNFTISLKSALTNGEHEITLTDGKKSWSGKVKV